MISEELTYECPDPIHIAENRFSPAMQGPYGPGYFGDCDWCDNNYLISEEVYLEYMEWDIHIKELNEQQRLVDRIMKSTRSNVI